MKECTRCRAVKELGCFNSNKKGLFGKRSWCKGCDAVYKKAYRQDNKEAINSYKSRYAKENPDIIREMGKKYRNKNRTDIVARNAKRRADKQRATPTWSEVPKIREFYRNCPEGYHVDHIVPLNSPKVCGLHVICNLQYLTANDNLRKSNSIPEEV